MPKSKIRGILTETERDRLINYNSIDVIERKNLNFRLKKKLNIIKDALEDINIMLNSLPDDTTKDYIDTKTALYSLATTEKILQLCAPWPVAEHNRGGLWAFKTVAERIESKPGKCYISTIAWNATDEEIAINQRLKKHIAALQHYTDPYLVDPICRNHGQLVPSDDEIVKAFRSGTRSVSESSNYNRSWKGKDGMVYTEPITVSEEELKFKRWNPKGLPRKYDVPEQSEKHPK